jgi:hypothetical protein
VHATCPTQPIHLDLITLIIFKTHGRGEECVQGFDGKARRKERDHLGEQGVDGRMGSECILGTLAGGV